MVFVEEEGAVLAVARNTSCISTFTVCATSETIQINDAHETPQPEAKVDILKIKVQ